MKPILFNTKMVRAILDGRKTTTRRAIKPRPPIDDSLIYRGMQNICFLNPRRMLYAAKFERKQLDGYCGWNPHFYPDDILYVRETFCKYDTDHVINGVKYAYKADATADSEEARKELGYKWRPSIHMPKEAARIFLRVTDVRAERLQNITWRGASDEGCQGSTSDEPDPLFHIPTLRGEFQKLWNSTVKKSDRDKYGWNANPWVWVIEFERCEKPEENDK